VTVEGELTDPKNKEPFKFPPVSTPKFNARKGFQEFRITGTWSRVNINLADVSVYVPAGCGGIVVFVWGYKL